MAIGDRKVLIRIISFCLNSVHQQPNATSSFRCFGTRLEASNRWAFSSIVRADTFVQHSRHTGSANTIALCRCAGRASKMHRVSSRGEKALNYQLRACTGGGTNSFKLTPLIQVPESDIAADPKHTHKVPSKTLMRHSTRALAWNTF